MNTSAFLLLLVVVAPITASPRKQTSLKQTTHHQQRILNGHEIDISDAKYYVLLACSGVICGGTILSYTRVVTAAHCLAHCETKNLEMHMGKNSWDEVGELYRADNIYTHPKYDEDNLRYDIAVVYVTGEIRPNDKVDRIHYLLNPAPVGSFVTSVGYGGISQGGFPTKLQATDNKIISYEKNLVILDSKDTGVAGGDSGGPCVYKNMFVGVTSIIFLDGNGRPERDGKIDITSSEIVSFIRSHGL